MDTKLHRNQEAWLLCGKMISLQYNAILTGMAHIFQFQFVWLLLNNPIIWLPKMLDRSMLVSSRPNKVLKNHSTINVLCGVFQWNQQGQWSIFEASHCHIRFVTLASIMRHKQKKHSKKLDAERILRNSVIKFVKPVGRRSSGFLQNTPISSFYAETYKN